MSQTIASAAIISAETILALTPIVIKQTPLDPVSAIWSRLLSSAVLGYFLTGDRVIAADEWGGAAALGYANLLHVASSYESFRHLPAGQAMSLLYTFPLWNLVFDHLLNHAEIKTSDYAFMGLATVGSVLLNLDPGTAAATAIGREARPAWGIFMGIIMALTESGMYAILKRLKWLDPAKSVWVVSSSASMWLAAALFLQELFYNDSHTGRILKSGSWWDAALLTAFHSVTLFGGYWLRFFAVPRLSTVTYSVLSYSGLLASYVFGLFILGERPGWMSLLGALVIVGAGLALQIKK